MKRTKQKRTRKTRRGGIFIAVVVKEKITPDPAYGLAFIPSNRTKGDWASFVGTDRDLVIRKAREATLEWNQGEYAPNAPYTILLGTLTSEVKFPINFEVVPL